MSSTIKYVLAFIFGIGAGAGGASFFFKKRMDKKIAQMEAELNEQFIKSEAKVADYCSIDMDEIDQTITEIRSEGQAIHDRNEMNDILLREKYNTAEELNKRKGELIDYSKFASVSSEDYEEDEFERTIQEAENWKAEEDDIVKGRPHQIDRGSFEDDSDWDKLEVVYFEGDGVVCVDEFTGEVMDDPEKDLGENFPDLYDDESGDPDIIYIRNPRLHLDYQVTRNGAAYNDMYGEEAIVSE